MNSLKLEHYKHPLQHVAPDVAKRERALQLKIALGCIVAGGIFNLGWIFIASLHLSNHASSNGAQAFDAILLVVTLGIAPYGLYRLARLRHFTERGLQNRFMHSDSEVYRYAKASQQEIAKQKVLKRQSMWLNQPLVSDRSLMTVLVVLFGAVLIGVAILTVAAAYSRN
jgi:hypothetical protein